MQCPAGRCGGVGGHEVALSHVGKVFPARGENLARWREWLRYVHLDQI